MVFQAHAIPKKSGHHDDSFELLRHVLNGVYVWGEQPLFQFS